MYGNTALTGISGDSVKRSRGRVHKYSVYEYDHVVSVLVNHFRITHANVQSFEWSRKGRERRREGGRMGERDTAPLIHTPVKIRHTCSLYWSVAPNFAQRSRIRATSKG